MEEKQIKSIKKYLAKQAPIAFSLLQRYADPPWKIAIVIPSFKERTLVQALDSLAQCEWSTQRGGVLLVVVLNESELASEEIRLLHQQQMTALKSWRKPEWMSLAVLHASAIPDKQAGVGLARKTGLDFVVSEALKRSEFPLLVNFDADSLVDKNYLGAILDYFLKRPKTNAASIYYEHPLDTDDEPSNERIALYELHLRCYRQMILSTGHPFAFHTVGSSMACTLEAYVKQGGMNRRKAGEDFYFLNKLMMLGNFGEINSTRVIPSARESDRVPFGTGRAILEMGKECYYATYAKAGFEHMKEMFQQLEEYFETAVWKVHPYLQEFLQEQSDYGTKLDLVRSNCSALAVFQTRFFACFDLFAVMKYLHFIRDEKGIESPSVVQFVQGNWGWEGASALELLPKMRQLERSLP